ncbi:hypothetical protein [Pseudoxanthomonas winnipegensis]|nr:hypothetical protein [Pseudoxanthomonas winnipegensis]
MSALPDTLHRRAWRAWSRAKATTARLRARVGKSIANGCQERA